MKDGIQIIDSHAHIFPDTIAEKAAKNIGKFYGIEMSSNGSVQGLLESGSKIGVDKYIVHSTATSLNQVKSINNFIIQQKNLHKEFIGFMTLHPDMEEAEIKEEIDRCIKEGLKGIKLHPDFQRFNIDCFKARKIYKNAEGRLPILFHMGDIRFDFSLPKRLVKIAKKYENLTCIAAHFGGYRHWQETGIYKGLKNVYFDTSSSLFLLAPKKAVEIIEMLGDDRFFFGVDYPMWPHSDEYERFKNLKLPKISEEKILNGNISALLGL